MRRLMTSSILLALALAGCPQPEPEQDAGPKDDAAAGHDAAVPDAWQAAALGATCAESAECDSANCLKLWGVGSGYCSKACTGDTDCNFGDGQQYTCLRWNAPINRVCTRTCNDSATCGSNGSCTYAVATELGPKNLCFMLEGLRCDSQADCATGACTYWYSGAEIVTYCDTSANAGQIAPGATCDPALGKATPCRNNQDCASGQSCNTYWSTCYPDPDHSCQAGTWACAQEGKCLAFCAADDDCPTDMLCAKASIQVNMGTTDPVDDVLTAYGYCFPIGGSRSSCTKESDCSVSTESCIAYQSIGGTFQQVCRTDASGSQPAGSVCADVPSTDAVEPEAICQANYCLVSHCSTICSTGADCSGSPDAQCLNFQLNAYGQNGKLCVPGKACVKDADCSATDHCQMLVYQGGTGGTCLPPNGTVAYGAACDTYARTKEQKACYAAADCTVLGVGWTCDDGHHCKAPRNILCETENGCLSDGKCSTLCAQDGDCTISGTAMHCAGMHTAVDGKGTPDPADDTDALLKICQPNVGSQTTCTKNADCTAGEVCMENLALDGSSTWKCMTERVTAADVGAACGVVGNNSVYCKSYFCDFENGDGKTDQGTCAARCVDTTDCPSPLTCQDFKPWAHLATTFKLCRTAAAGAP